MFKNHFLQHLPSAIFSVFFHLEDPVIAILSYKAQEVDTPGVHQLIVGRACHSTGCLRYTRDHTLAVHLQRCAHRHRTMMVTRKRFWYQNGEYLLQGRWFSCFSIDCTWCVTKECNLTSALSRTSFQTSSPYDSLIKSWRLSHSSPYILLSLWVEAQAEHCTPALWVLIVFPEGSCKRIRKIYNNDYSCTPKRLLMNLAFCTNLVIHWLKLQLLSLNTTWGVSTFFTLPDKWGVYLRAEKANGFKGAQLVQPSGSE